ncbi:MAG: DUF2163 domain-containing protein [Pseudomonadota bacterium]
MRALPSTLSASLATGCTTHCRCWQVARRDGVTLGFTDHDRDIAFDGVVHRAEAGLTAGALELSTGLRLDSQEVAGALTSEAIHEDDILKGLYDGAAVRQYLVDWQAPESRLLLSAGTVGEIRRRGTAFEAEILGLSEALNRPFGRVYSRFSTVALGQPGCGVDLDDPAYVATGTVGAVLAVDRLEAHGLEAHATGHFGDGRLTWLTGANAGAVGHVRRHGVAEGVVTLELWNIAPLAMAEGDSFEVAAGCARDAATWKARFGNLHDFRGFPHLPGDDHAAGYPREGGEHDGGSLFRS